MANAIKNPCFLGKQGTHFLLFYMGFGTGDGNRTHVSSLGSSRPTIERHPRVEMEEPYSTAGRRSSKKKKIMLLEKMLAKVRRSAKMQTSSGYSLMVKLQPSKLITRVRFPLPAPLFLF